MPVEIKLPELGENLAGGEVVDVKVAAGESVREGQTLLEVEAEKSTVEVPAPQAGKLAKWLVKRGDAVKVGQALCVLDGAEAEVSEKAAAKPKEKPRNFLEGSRRRARGRASPGESNRDEACRR